MTFHRAFLLEYENALLSVVPGLKAMPYLDITLDLPGGKCSVHPTSLSTCPVPENAVLVALLYLRHLMISPALPPTAHPPCRQVLRHQQEHLL
jgi:hypothetical protein